MRNEFKMAAVTVSLRVDARAHCASKALRHALDTGTGSAAQLEPESETGARLAIAAVVDAGGGPVSRYQCAPFPSPTQQLTFTDIFPEHNSYEHSR